jgi:hypothetical protein
MRLLFLTCLFGPAFRYPALSAVAQAVKPLALEYPICKRNFSTKGSSVPLNYMRMATNAEACNVGSGMADESQEDTGRGKADSTIKMEKTTSDAANPPPPEEHKLPKLSLAEFRVYNSMAEHMEYFVRRISGQ